ncbi:MAG: winged helix-turn-helix transcriptional regulator [Thaumarchaeota archaeon]|nr:winged helix-turn-helix transcriptional regulator [Nitrososphaerota archaeon]
MTLKSFIWYILAGSRGGESRARIVKALKDRPYNANQLAEILKMNYKTVRHHLKVLKDAGIIVIMERKYGSVYTLSEEMEKIFEEFKEIWDKIG